MLLCTGPFFLTKHSSLSCLHSRQMNRVRVFQDLCMCLDKRATCVQRSRPSRKWTKMPDPLGPSPLHPLPHGDSSASWPGSLLLFSFPGVRAVPSSSQVPHHPPAPAPTPFPSGLDQSLPELPPASSDPVVLPALPASVSSLYICLMNISISRAQLFPLNKQSADFIAGLLFTYLFRALNHS